jgi:CDP-glycerol glycerophosphotransferase (TagB/SpsB family)
MDKLVRLVIAGLYVPINWISWISPRKENVYLFGSWFGESYSDNSKYLFEYIAQKSGVVCVWLTRSRPVLKEVRSRGHLSYRSHSPCGIYYMLTAKFAVISAGRGDLNPFISTKRLNIINLFHGAPLKKILFDDEITFKAPSGLLSHLFPVYSQTRYDLICASSEVVKKCYISAFRVDENVVKVTGFPRVDKLIQNRHKETSNLLRGIYLPTHRGEGDNVFSEKFSRILEGIDQGLNSCLGVTLDLKMHHYFRKENYSLKNINFVKEEMIGGDIYNILADYDFLVTDYSSIFFDYLVLDRPIIFFPFDLSEYLRKDRQLYFDYDSIAAGPKVISVKELLDEFQSLRSGVDRFSLKRRELMSEFNSYLDGNNCERVLDEMLKIDS